MKWAVSHCDSAHFANPSGRTPKRHGLRGMLISHHSFVFLADFE